MCGRYSLASADPTKLLARFPIGEAVQIERRFNVAPGDPLLTVTTNREGQPRGSLLRWGLVPPWSEDPRDGFKMINARAETLGERPAFRQALERFRCLIVADGFYEWQRRDHAAKQPFHITRVDHEPFAFAGLWSVWHRGQPDELRSCTIVTTAANELIAPIHHRMPVILESNRESDWLDPEASPALLHELLSGLPASQLATRPVGTAVNDAHYDGPDCLNDPPPEAQSALFT